MQPITPPDLATPWEEVIQLKTRARSCLINAQTHTLGDIVQKTRHEFLLIPNFGRRCLNELEEELSRVGLKLAEEKKSE